MSPVENPVGVTSAPGQGYSRSFLKLKGQAFPVKTGSLPHTDAAQYGFHRLRYLCFQNFKKNTTFYIF
jgi:hypothetical protein